MHQSSNDVRMAPTPRDSKRADDRTRRPPALQCAPALQCPPALQRRSAAAVRSPLRRGLIALVSCCLLAGAPRSAAAQESSSLDVELARAKNQQKTAKAEAVVVSISARGAFEVDKILVDPGALESYLCAQASSGKTTLHIRADKDSKHEDLVHAMDLAKTCGFESLGILHQN